MNREEELKYREEELKRIEHTLRNAERFIVSCLKANEALRQIQRGNMKTVTRYWRDEE